MMSRFSKGRRGRTAVMAGSVAAATATILAAANPAHAQTWDGGGTDNNWTTAANWSGDTTPANDGTAAITLDGVIRLTPAVDVNYNVNSVTFANTAGAF